MSEQNPNTRLEAFCDGVFAIAITLLIIEVKIPSPEGIHNTTDLWNAIQHIAPSIFAFVLSFTIILITWVNHHHNIKLVNKSSSRFIYANGFLLLSIAFLPFPTALMGEYISTDHSAPAVILFNFTLAISAAAWIMITRTAIADGLGKSEKATKTLRQNGVFGIYAVALYTLFAVLAIWIPRTIAVTTTLTWILWLFAGIRIRHEQMN